MNHRLLAFGLAAALALPAQAQTPGATVRPENFRYRTQIDLPAAGGPFYQFSLNLPVYQGVQREDLGDVRVFNSQGEAVPYTLLRPLDTPQAKEARQAVPIFPIAEQQDADAQTSDVSLQVQRKPDGTLVATSKNKGGKTLAVVGSVIDVSKVRETIHALHILAQPSTTPFHPLSIETSDDLQQWRLLAGGVQWVHLQQGGQTIDKDTFELDGKAGKYLRVLWQDADAPTITGAEVLTRKFAPLGSHMLWTESLQAVQSENNHYDYALPGKIPLETLRIALPQVNTLAPMQVQRYLPPTPDRQKGSWETISQSVAYRLQSPKSEVTSPDLALDAPPAQQLRLAFDASGGGIGNAAPTLQVGFVPQTLVFLARGNGPFVLAWGADKVSGSAMPAATLLPNYREDQEVAATAATLQPVAAIVASAGPVAPAEAGKSKGLLWGVLGVGLLVLVGMVVMLLRQMKQTK
ncbi:MAG TPA: DUF3999 domain-containing protein [Burkholderiaceae bacterium]